LYHSRRRCGGGCDGRGALCAASCCRAGGHILTRSDVPAALAYCLLQGAGQKLIIPLLDDIVGGKNRTDAIAPLTVAGAVEVAKEAFVTAGERDIYTGDAVEIYRRVHG
jgi:hypothetical protein